MLTMRLEANAIGQVRLRLLLYVFFICLFLDLGGSLGFRQVAIAIVGIMLLIHPTALVVVFRRPEVLGIFFVWPLLAALIGFFNNAEIALLIQNILALISFPFLVAFFSLFRLRDSVWAFKSAALTVAAITIIFWFAVLIGNEFAIATAEKLSEIEVGFFGLRELGGLTFAVVYFKSTLFYVPAGILLLYSKRFVACLLMLVALVAATSKTGVAVSTIFLLVKAFRSRRPRWLVIGGLVVGSIGFAGYIGSTVSDVFSALSTDVNTVTVRVEHWESLWSLFKENPFTPIFGQGAGTKFYSSAVEEYVNNIELDHLNSIRKFGIVWFSVFSIFIINIVYILYRQNEKYLAMALATTFIICGTNPLLLTLLFMSLLAISYVASSHSAADRDE